MFKSTLVVLAGFGTMTVLTLILFAALARLAPSQFAPEPPAAPGTGWILAILLGGLLAAIAGGWLTGRLAPAPMWGHVAGLAAVVLAMGVLTMIFENDHPGPMWYRLALPVVGTGGVFLGGRLA